MRSNGRFRMKQVILIPGHTIWGGAANHEFTNAAMGKALRGNRRVRLNFDDLQSEKSYQGLPAYSHSKLANLLFTHELARRLNPLRITVNALHPGFVATDIGVRHGLMPAFAWWLVKFAALRPEQGAATSIYLASSPEVADAHGLYFHKCKPIKPSQEALDSDAARCLWEISTRLTGIDLGGSQFS